MKYLVVLLNLDGTFRRWFFDDEDDVVDFVAGLLLRVPQERLVVIRLSRASNVFLAMRLAKMQLALTVGAGRG